MSKEAQITRKMNLVQRRKCQVPLDRNRAPRILGRTNAPSKGRQKSSPEELAFSLILKVPPELLSIQRAQERPAQQDPAANTQQRIRFDFTPGFPYTWNH